METTYKEYKPSLKGYYKLLLLIIIVLALAIASSFTASLANYKKIIWIAAAIIDVLLLVYILIQRSTMKLILRDNPDKPEDQEVAFVVYHPTKPFSSKFKESIEIGLNNVEHIRVGQTMLQSILHIGDVVIASSGSGDEEIHAQNIPHPEEVRDEIQVHARRYKQS